MVDIERQKRTRGKTTRPAIDIPIQTWVSFAAKYPDKNIRDGLINQFLLLQMGSNLINPNIIKFNPNSN